MQVDDLPQDIVAAILDRLPENWETRDTIAATLAVAAERGLLVPANAPRMWGVKNERGIVEEVFDTERDALCFRMIGETVVRVAVVETKE